MKTKLDRKIVLNFSFLLILLSMNLNLNAQNADEDKQTWIVGNLNLLVNGVANTRFDLNIENEGIVQFRESVKSVNLGLGIRIVNEKKWFHEISITALSIKLGDDIGIIERTTPQLIEPLAGMYRKSVFVYLRWEYGKLFEIKGIERMQFGLSMSIDPFLNHRKIEPKTSIGFPKKQVSIGTELRLIPRLSYRLRENIEVTLKFPIGLNSTYFEHVYLDNPILTGSDRIRNSFHSILGVKDLQSSIGLSYQL